MQTAANNFQYHWTKFIRSQTGPVIKTNKMTFHSVNNINMIFACTYKDNGPTVAHSHSLGGQGVIKTMVQLWLTHIHWVARVL